MKLERSDPPIYLSQIDYAGISETLAWSSPNKARTYLTDRVPGDVSWPDEMQGGSTDVAVVDGEIAGKVERVTIADPASLASSIEKYPSPAHVFDSSFGKEE